MSIPFEGLRPAPGRHDAAWVVESMAAGGGVTSVVPHTFDAFARIHHRIHCGERWATFAPDYLV